MQEHQLAMSIFENVKRALSFIPFVASSKENPPDIPQPCAGG